jgi:3,4-dihydroxy 2-butanone 4-phosphate synthase / GTP cyclohydrolase II
MTVNSIEEIIQDVREGKMVLLMDDEARENEGDVVMAAECVTAEHINFMARHARGLICMPMSKDHSEQLGLGLMVERSGSGFGTKFTASIEAAEGVTTGISAPDRARTVQVAAARDATPADIVQPGHIFPLVAEPGGVLIRAGHTEAACDLARLAGFGETGVICEVMRDDGAMARRPDLEVFAREHGLKIGTIADLIQYRLAHESTVELLGMKPVTTEHGDFEMHTFRDRINGVIHLALVRGTIDPDQPILTRVQVGTTIRDLLGIQLPGSSGWTLQRSLAHIAAAGAGVLVLLTAHESADDLLYSIDLLSRSPLPSSPRSRESHRAFLTVGVGSRILRALGVRKLRLMCAPAKYAGISGFELEVTGYVSPETMDVGAR